MSYLRLSILVLCALIVSCAPPPHDPTPTADSQAVSLAYADITVALDTLPGWVAYTNDDAHLVLSEHVQPVDSNGIYNGLIVTLWMPDKLQPTTEATPAALVDVLNDVIRGERDGSRAAIGEARTFTWDKNDAAYYLLNTGDGNLSMILAMRLPDVEQYVAVHINTAADDAGRIPQMLPQIFSSLRVNNTAIASEGLATLPQVLEIPNANPEAAMEASEQP